MIRGHGDFIIRNSTFRIYSTPEDSMASIARFDRGVGLTNKTFITHLENIYLTNDFFDTTTIDVTPSYVKLDGGTYINMNVTLTNWTLEKLYGSGTTNNLRIRPGAGNNLLLKDITFKSIESNVPVLLTAPMNELIIENLVFINCTIINTQAVFLTTSNLLNITNAIFSNITLTGHFEGYFIELVGLVFNCYRKEQKTLLLK